MDKGMLHTRKLLDEVSPSFCLAKWFQVTLYLQSGHTHSCHNPKSHRVPMDELNAHPDALHNTAQKMLARKEMLEGKRPEECKHCWRIEDISSNLLSDRLLKSSEPWASPHFAKARSMPWDQHVLPTYLEVSFSNTCNFKCAYCSPYASSKWMEEIREHGPYPIEIAGGGHNSLEYLLRGEKMPILESETNPYLDAFWKWWPDLYPALEVFRITGGEPLLTRNTFRALDYVSEHPRPDLELAVNSNLGVPPKLIQEFVSKARGLIEGRKVKLFTVFTSVDTWGSQAEYIRYGMNFDTYWKNVRLLLTEVPGLQLSFMCTVNALCAPNLHRLLQAVLELKREFGALADGRPRVMIDLPYLQQPDFLSTQILPPELASKLESCARFVDQHVGPNGFREVERDMMNRLVQWLKEPVSASWLSLARSNFARFIITYDQRRGTDFLRSFPEFTSFYELCLLERVR